MQERFLSAAEAARYLSVSVATLHRLRYAGEIEHLKIHSKVLFEKHALDDFIDRSRVQAWGIAK